MIIDFYKKDDTVKLPVRSTYGSSGYDLFANNFKKLYSSNDTISDINDLQVVTLKPNERILIGTGLFSEVPHGYELLIRPRSGLALKHGITVLNSPGTIDSDYRGEIGVILINHSLTSQTINIGERIAQMVLSPVWNIEFNIIDNLNDTTRSGGFGSTGK